MDPDETAASGLTELGAVEADEDDLPPGEATSELDVPAIPVGELPTGAAPAPEPEEPAEPEPTLE